MENGPASRVAFADGAALPFPRGGPAGRQLPTGADRDDRLFRSPGEYWSPPSDHVSEDDDEVDDNEEEEEDDDEDDDPDEGDGFVSVDEINNKNANNVSNNNNNSSGSVQSSSENLRDAERTSCQEHHSSYGSGRGGVVGKEGSGEQYQKGRPGIYENAITVVAPEQYYANVLHGGDGVGVGQKDMGAKNGCAFEFSVDSGESVRVHFTDPITGALMDDAMILPCGHSFGCGGMQHVYRMKACYKCAQPISEDSVRPNLALRAAVQAFSREELQSFKVSKRRRDRLEQDKCGYDDPFPVDNSRGKGVQFPFVVSDRVIIKGNKRTPERFVGRMAVVTTQCLNGWYVVKTLDNAESVKLQYRSLAKVTDDPSSNMGSNKAVAPSWL